MEEILQELGYRENVQALFKAKSTSRFLNGSPWHAAYIFEAMLQYATDSVNIFCRNLNESVFSHAFIQKALAAINPNVKVTILVQSCEDDIESKNLYDKINKKEYPGVSVQLIKNVNTKRLQYNFAVMDGRAFRFEPTRDAIAAIASANEPSTAQILITRFNTIQKREQDAATTE